MRYILGFLLLGLGALALGLTEPAARADEKGEEVELDGLKSKAPAGWKMKQPSNRFRAFEFTVPKVKGDAADADMIIYYFGEGGGGGTEANIERWKGFFDPPEGKKIDEVAKVDKFKVGNVPVTYVDIQGTYKDRFPPFDPNAKITLRPNYRMIGVVFASPKGPYFLRLIGPAKTVTENKEAFDSWLKGFK